MYLCRRKFTRLYRNYTKMYITFVFKATTIYKYDITDFSKDITKKLNTYLSDAALHYVACGIRYGLKAYYLIFHYNPPENE